MLAKIKSFGLIGIDGYEVEVEIDICSGLPGMEVVGLPDTAIKEAKERVRSAIKNSGFKFSPQKITINLAPADTKKEGACYDLALALGILVATEQIPVLSQPIIFLGELSLDGSLRHVKGIMPMLIAARAKGYKTIVVPSQNAAEASYIDGVDVFSFCCLKDVLEFIKGKEFFPVEKRDLVSSQNHRNSTEDFKYVKGQFAAKRALEIAAAGNHNILMIGPPGGGKTMLAKCLPSILPTLTISEALETTKIHSISGVLDERGIVGSRPFRSPHHTASKISLTGGGNNARPGEISLAHNGVLYLDELLEYPRATLEILRQPLEDNVINIARANKTIEYPANFMLVASMNPCPCGYFGSSVTECTCTPAQISKYLSRLSGPLLDRIDLHIEVDNVTYDELSASAEAESSNCIARRVNAAREVQLKRYQGTSVFSNAKMNNAMVRTYCKLDEKSELLLKNAFEKLSMSARAYTRILKVARTIADLADSEEIKQNHVAEAIQYRSLDRSYWK